jgi:cytochrome c biogenesis protein CcdA
VSDRPDDPGDVLVRVGGIVFGVGMLATVATFVPLFLDLTRLPTFAYWLSMLMPLGLLVALAGLFANARSSSRRRRARRAAATATGTAAAG